MEPKILTPVRMRHETDCEVAAIATSVGVTWEEAREAVGWRNLPGPLENPLYGNPIQVERALSRLGYRCRQVSLADLEAGRAPVGTLVLVHWGGEGRHLWSEIQATMRQHWVVYDGLTTDGRIRLWWGDAWRIVQRATMGRLYGQGWPNCAMAPEPGRAAWWIRWWPWVVLAAGLAMVGAILR